MEPRRDPGEGGMRYLAAPQAGEPDASVREQVDLVRRVLRKQWLLVVVLALAAGGAAFGTSRLLSPVYEASTTVRIVRRPALMEEALPRRGDVRQRGALSPEAALFTTELILRPVIERLALEHSPRGGLLEEGMAKAKDVMRELAGRPFREDARYYELLEHLRKRCVTVKEMEGLDILEVQVQWHDPEMAMRIANTLADVFVERYQETNRARAQRDRTYLEQQTKLVAGQLKESEKALVEFQKRTGIVLGRDGDLGMPSQASLERLTTEKRQLELLRQASGAEQERLQATVDPDSEADKGSISPVLKAALGEPTSRLRVLMNQMTAAEIALEKSKGHFSDSYIPTSRAYKELASLRVQLREALEEVGANPDIAMNELLVLVEVSDKSGARARASEQMQVEQALLEARMGAYDDQLARLNAEITEAEQATKDLPVEMQQYLALAREQRVNEILYAKLSERLAGAQVDENSDVYEVQVFEPAHLPMDALKPKPVLLAGVGAFLGLLLGICFAFLREYLDDSLRTSQDVSVFLGLPVLAEIPKVTVRRKLGSARKLSTRVGGRRYRLMP